MSGKHFEVDMGKISEVVGCVELEGLSVKAYNQGDLESGLIEQVKEKEMDELRAEISSINKLIKKVGHELDSIGQSSEAFTKKKVELQGLLKKKDNKEKLMMSLIEDNDDDDDYLMSGIQNNGGNIENFGHHANYEVENDDCANNNNYNNNHTNNSTTPNTTTTTNNNNINNNVNKKNTTTNNNNIKSTTTTNNINNNNSNNDSLKRSYSESHNLYDNVKKRRKMDIVNINSNYSDDEEEDDEDYNDDDYDPDSNMNNDDEDEDEYDDNDDQLTNGEKRGIQRKRDKGTRSDTRRQTGRDKWGRDDQDFDKYLHRLQDVLGHCDEEKVQICDSLEISSSIWNKLYPHQQHAVKWLWTLHNEKVGGILGDEMGLGKTIELLSFFLALHTSQLIDRDFNTTNSFLSYKGLGTSLIVCPSTVMTQWVHECRQWAALFRVVVVHGGAGREVGKHGVECRGDGKFGARKKSKKVENLLKELFKSKQRVPLTSKLRHQPPLLIVTSYNTLIYHHQSFLSVPWHYVVLDEGHKIKNPETQISQLCRKLSTSHRIILSGSPLQNNLTELWALFDFVYPGKLGTKEDFCTHFNLPILMGGYANSSDFQVQTSHRCAKVLKATIEPYLLRRTKKQVNHHVSLPGKSEQVLFCRLTTSQQDHYSNYLLSSQCRDILSGRMNPFPGIMMLRKICNHVRLVSRTHNNQVHKGISPKNKTLAAKKRAGENTIEAGYEEEEEETSVDYLGGGGKMVVVDALLKVWKKQKHKVLLFSQSRKMLSLLESFIVSKGYTYVRMDGTTNITSRQHTIQRFNKDDAIFLFLLTTKVGGLGLNLTAANRVIIYDPDWNPCTDMQARERAWRIGQSRDVCVYRLLTAGTIEEKIYHRQIFKQFLSNRVMCNSKQRRFFKLNHLKELFSLPQDSEITETACLFVDSDVRLKKDKKRLDDEAASSSGRGCSEGSCKENENNDSDRDHNTENIDIKMDEVCDGDKEDGELIENEGMSLDGWNGGMEGTLVDESTQRMREIARKMSIKIGEKQVNKSNKKSKKEKKNKKEDVMVDGCVLGNVSRMEKYKKEKHKEKKLIAKLFRKKGVHSALKHDKIMSNSYKDDKLVRLQAEAVAMEAVKMLRESQEKLKKKRFGARGSGEVEREAVMTATNNSVAPDVDGAGLPASSSLLRHLKSMARVPYHTAANDVADQAGDNISFSNVVANMPRDTGVVNEDNRNIGVKSNAFWQADDKTIDLGRDIKDFMMGKKGWVRSQKIVDAFKNKLSKEQTLTFKHLTKQLCHHKKSQGVGYYKLKENV